MHACCIWCGTTILAERASKKVCSNSCQGYFYRWRDTHHLTNAESFKLLEILTNLNNHPNRGYSYKHNEKA